MSPAEIDKVFRTYMDGLTGHNMAVFKSGTCPRLRSTLLGFALNGYDIGKWTLLPYEVPADADRIIVKAKMTQLKPRTRSGCAATESGGSHGPAAGRGVATGQRCHR